MPEATDLDYLPCINCWYQLANARLLFFGKAVICAQRLGVDTDGMLLCQPDSGEMALEVADQLVRSQSVDIIAVDSVAALVPRSEIEGEIGNLQCESTTLAPLQKFKWILPCPGHVITDSLAESHNKVLWVAPVSTRRPLSMAFALDCWASLRSCTERRGCLVREKWWTQDTHDSEAHESAPIDHLHGDVCCRMDSLKPLQRSDHS